MGDSTDDLMGRLLFQKAQKAIAPLTEELHTLFSSMGCDPHCHFCLEPLKVGDEFGLKTLKPGISGTACAQCILEDRPAPKVEVAAAYERREAMRVTPQGSTPSQHHGFLLFD